jgi:hypothetical protein
MKTTIKYFFITLIYSSLMLSCNKDEEDVNLPPEDVTNIQATVISGTMVRISWNAALDKNKDPIKYEVVVNEKILAKNILETSLEVDIEEFIPNRSGSGKSAKNGTKDFAAKMGLEVVLGIEIKAFDGSGGFSSESVIKNLSINRAPEDFSFANIYFDVEGFNYLEVSWSPAIDKDGDKITYSVYLNSIELAKDASILAGNPYGYVYYYNNYANLAEEEITVKVVAKDTSGETKEISESYKFKETDIDLGTLSLPYTGTLDYFIDSDEPDDRIGIKFTISEEQGYLFSVDMDYLSLILRGSNNTYYANSNQKINGGGLAPGSYYLDLVNNYYSDSNASGILTIVVQNAKQTDLDLGILATPSEGSLNYDLSNEIDGVINFYFEVEENTGYIFKDDSNVNMAIFDSNGSYYNYYYNIVKGADLPPGVYRLEISSFNSDQQGTVNYQLKDSGLSDKNLGILSVNDPTEVSFNFDGEPDDKIVYTFTIDDNTGYSFYSFSDVQLNLLDSNGYSINGSGYRRITGKFLVPGTYSLELYSQYQLSSTIILSFSDASEGDMDLGVLELPFSQTFNTTFDIGNADDSIVFFLETDEISNYNFNVSNGLYVEFKNTNGNYVYSGYSSFSGTSLPAGNYVVEVRALDYYYNSGTINGVISMQFTQ